MIPLHLKKQQREQHILESFISVAGLNAFIERCGNPETEPDFIISFNGEPVGVELTELFRDRLVGKVKKEESIGIGKKKISPSKKREAIDQRELAEVKRLYYESCKIPITVDFVGSLPRGADEKKRITEQLIDIAETTEEHKAKDRYELGNGIVAYVRRISKEFAARGVSRWSFASNHVGWRKSITRAMLEAVIQPKCAKLKKYKIVSEKIFLLIHADKTWQSGMVSFDNDGSVISASGFEAIYLYTHPDRAIRLC